MANEKRLIDAYALWAEFMDYADTGIEFDGEGVANAIANAPTVDAVEVVRCKDCKHRENLLGEMCCPYYEDLPVEDNHFCAYGERKDNEREAD